MKNKRKKFWRNFKFKYKLTITNENTLEEVVGIHVSKLNGVSVLLFAVTVIFLIAATIIAFTPLRNYLPGYVLVLAELVGEIAHDLRFTPNCLGFLGGLDNPTPLQESEVNRILGKVDETVDDLEIEIPYAVGEAVKVTDGPFTGFSGLIEEVNTEKRKLTVAVKVFGRNTPLDLSFTQVEKE